MPRRHHPPVAAGCREGIRLFAFIPAAARMRRLPLVDHQQAPIPDNASRSIALSPLNARISRPDSVMPLALKTRKYWQRS